jgi:tripartite-type tricarboxylate transporter receptor subunit TctC
VIADRPGALWKVPTVVENIAGAAGNLGMDRVAKGASDGGQILIVPPGIATNQFPYPRVPFDPEKDFSLLGHVASVPNLLCVREDLPVNSVAELIAYAKANPGKLNYASSGIGTTVHLSAELFKRMTGVDMVHVAYRGSAPALNDLVGQNVDDHRPGPRRRGQTTRHHFAAALDAGAGVRADRRDGAGLRHDVLDRRGGPGRNAQGHLR